MRPQSLQAFERWLEARSPASTLALALAGVLAIGVADYLTGPEFGSSIFYMLPIYVAVARGGRGLGVPVSLASMLVWAAADVLVRPDLSHFAATAWNSGVRLGFFLLFTFLLAAQRAQTAIIRRLASTDSMTGLLNVRAFGERVKEELARCRRYHTIFSLAYLDLDNFKQVNDSFGHSAGDAVLHSVAQSMRSTLRENDAAARLGGDEFAILMPETGCDGVRAVMERMRRQLLYKTTQHGCPVTCSIGVVTFREAPQQVDAVLRAADEAMYRAKRAGKNTLVCREGA